MSRTTSTNTVTQMQHASPRPHQGLIRKDSPRLLTATAVEKPRVNRLRLLPRPAHRSLIRTTSPSAIASDSSASSSSESEPVHPMHRSRTFARRPRYSSSKAPLTLSPMPKKKTRTRSHSSPFQMPGQLPHLHQWILVLPSRSHRRDRPHNDIPRAQVLSSKPYIFRKPPTHPRHPPNLSLNPKVVPSRTPYPRFRQDKDT